MDSKIKQTLLLVIYYLSPLIISIIYWFEEPDPFSLESNDLMIHRVASILGIFSFIWMCFNILIMIRIKLIETNFSLDWILKFHKIQAVIAILFGGIHARAVLFQEPYLTSQVISGVIGSLIIMLLMLLALIYMTNQYIKYNIIKKMRLSAYKKNFTYPINKALHNFTILALFIIFIHTLLSYTVKNRMVITSMYFFFFCITLIGWVYHKLIRRLRSKSDLNFYRKALWDSSEPEITEGRNSEWALNLIKQNPSLYPCLQCGSCTVVCPIAEISKGDFNPRKIIKNSLLGLKDRTLIDKMPNVWDCTVCNFCDEICPQHVKLTEIFSLLKNIFAEQKEAPEGFLGEAEVVYKFGVSIPIQSALIERRKKLNLPPRPEFDIQEIQDLMELTGFDKLVEKPKLKDEKEET